MRTEGRREGQIALLKQLGTLADNLRGQQGPPSKNTKFSQPQDYRRHYITNIQKAPAQHDGSQQARGPSSLAVEANLWRLLIPEGFVFICLKL